MLTTFRKHANAMARPICIMLLLAASPCLAQSKRGEITTNVPFPFMVADHILPPGRYIVTPFGETNLRIHANKESVIVQAHSIASGMPAGPARMVFHRYGSVYFLSEVWGPSKETGSQLFPSKAEKELTTTTNREIAVLVCGP